MNQPFQAFNKIDLSTARFNEAAFRSKLFLPSGPRLEPIKAIISDCDGVLVRTEDLRQYSAELTAQLESYKAYFPEKISPGYFSEILGVTKEQRREIILSKSTLPENLYEQFLGDRSRVLKTIANFEASNDQEIKDALIKTGKSELEFNGYLPMPGIEKFLALITERQLPFVIVTQSYRAEVLEHFSFSAEEGKIKLPPQTVLLTKDDLLLSELKPAPGCYLRAVAFVAQKSGINPENIIVLEDSDIGLTAARTAGQRIFHVGRAPGKAQDGRGIVAAGRSLEDFCDYLSLCEYTENYRHGR